ncbi:ATP-binding protein [Actinoplanes couchii]|uniref:Histidine kinase/HSP90-like ATPase domain-containing protein n=1 Tax=Actinoplanes couchii TaxID=403638 RepID=A0ABQ3XP16_9ACTN|nr:ATP-binding protein [Actinoplanes couchii]MDR6319627.1 anti-sigma regulatory factor (Ser/Thr protein kinase) [Actinoplanes couchii]GID60150.1 hypothetical protein Aco03nite_085540 [Actinoplanes couchii]
MDDLRLPFHRSLDSARIRHAVRATLPDDVDADLADDVLLVVSELVQNVVHHTAGGGELRLSHRDGAIAIEVADVSTDPPHIHGPDARRVRGRGLMIVAAVSRAWGTRARDQGKVVWAEIDFPGPPPAAAHGRVATAP